MENEVVTSIQLKDDVFSSPGNAGDLLSGEDSREMIFRRKDNIPSVNCNSEKLLIAKGL